jgi:hypothetical protein
MADELLEEQIKKKKRTVLLVLFLLLLVTAGAAVFLEPPPALTPEVAEVKPNPSPSHPAATPTTITLTPTLQQGQGNEWSYPTTSSPNGMNGTAAPLTTAIASATPTVEARNNIITPESPQQSEIKLSPTPHKVSPIPTRPGVEIEETISTPAVSPIATISPLEGTSAASTSPTPDLQEATGAFVTPASVESHGESDEHQVPLASGEVTPVAAEISKRINESWDILDGDEAASAETGASSTPLTSTVTLTGTSALSETVALIPPDGLPVTGIIARREMNWVALAMVVLLIGAGSIALLIPNLKIAENNDSDS